MRDLPVASRVAQSAYVAAYYVWKPWWPVRLSPLYDALVDFRPTDWPFVLSMAAVAAACAAAVALARRLPAAPVAWFGYLAAAAPFFGLTEKPHMTSDRYGCLLTAVAARLSQSPSSPGFLKAAAIMAEKRRISPYYGPVSLLAILQDQMGLRFAREGSMREANDHFEEALREDDRFYQAAYDRALVLLRLGRCDDALRSFLLSARWAPSGLPDAQRHEFLARLEAAAGESGRPALARAARIALSR